MARKRFLTELNKKNYIKMGFNVAFLRAGDFKKFKKDYKDFI